MVSHLGNTATGYIHGAGVNVPMNHSQAVQTGESTVQTRHDVRTELLANALALQGQRLPTIFI